MTTLTPVHFFAIRGRRKRGFGDEVAFDNGREESLMTEGMILKSNFSDWLGFFFLRFIPYTN